VGTMRRGAGGGKHMAQGFVRGDEVGMWGAWLEVPAQGFLTHRFGAFRTPRHHQCTSATACFQLTSPALPFFVCERRPAACVLYAHVFHLHGALL
jgi:hypothetical protein